MSRDLEQRLDGIIEACNRVSEYISGYDLAKFEDDYKTQDAVIRQFEIIGEAVKRLPDSFTLQEPPFLGGSLRDLGMFWLTLISRSMSLLSGRQRASLRRSFEGCARVCVADGNLLSC